MTTASGCHATTSLSSTTSDHTTIEAASGTASRDERTPTTTTRPEPVNSVDSHGQPDSSAVPSSFIQWRQTLELGYVAGNTVPRHKPICFYCSRPESASSSSSSSTQAPLLRCGKCRVAFYCQKECQRSDWKREDGGHRNACRSYQRVGPSQTLVSVTDQTEAREEIMTRIRFYAYPYAVHKTQTLGRGFLFLQSTQTLSVLSLARPIDCWGYPTGTRAVLVHFLTMAEYNGEVCREDFEMATVRGALEQAVQTYDETTHVVLLMRFRCGHMALGVASLVPDYQQCRQLGAMYYANVSAGAVELQIDDI